jgi:hypothetical protein
MAWATKSTRRIARWQRQPCGFEIRLVARDRTSAHVKDLELLTKLDECPRRPHRGHQRSDGPQRHFGVTETVYRHEIRPVLTTGATSMDKILSKKRPAAAHLGANHTRLTSTQPRCRSPPPGATPAERRKPA